MAKGNEVMVLESVGGVGENNHKLNWNPITNLLNVESVYLQCDNNLVKNNELHLVVIIV
jgi:hypothetical protein